MGNNIKLQDLDLSLEEERNIIEFIAQKRGVTTKKILSTIKANPERKNNQNLTPGKPLKNPTAKNNQNLTPEKPLKIPKPKNNQNLTSKNKERIGIIREELKELAYKLSKSELKEYSRKQKGFMKFEKTPKISQ